MSHPGYLAHDDLQQLLDAIRAQGYEVVGPQVREGAIVYDTMTRVETLPRGIHDLQSPGAYRLENTNSHRYFDWANGPQALKPLSFRPQEVLWQARKGEDGSMAFHTVEPEHRKRAVLGVRSCDIAALFIHDKHFMHDQIQDNHYAIQRKEMFLVVVHCTHPAQTCFCASTGDGPRATFGYDMALSEFDEGFIVETRTERARQIVESLALMAATGEQLALANAEIEQAAAQQTQTLPACARTTSVLPDDTLSELLFDRLEHKRWDAIAERCLACGNCTSVCPTCFCHQHGEEVSLDTSVVSHYREWDSCFTANHSYIHGKTIRATTRLRYRQWLTHKFGSWYEQYGRSGCVGCGRCISWCPVGIDVVEELNALCTDAAPGSTHGTEVEHV